MLEAIQRLLGHGISSGHLFGLVWCGYVAGFGSVMVPAFLVTGAVAALDGEPTALVIAPLVLVVLAVQGVMFGAIVVAGLWLLGKIAGLAARRPAS